MKEKIINNKSINDKIKISVCMVSDFFFPKMGGVEVMIYQLSLSLIRHGVKVIVITRSYNNRKVIRYMGNGLKVYYLPVETISNEVMIPTLYGLFPKFREIIISEEINILHMHQSTSTIGLECVMHAKTLGINCVYTDHSLFSFDDLTCVNINKVLKAYLTDIDQTISVSNLGRENLILRTMIDPRITNVIPNSVDITKFKPEIYNELNESEKKLELLDFLTNRIKINFEKEFDSQLIDRKYLFDKESYINIIFLSRLTFRKGVDLLIEVIPEICNIFPNVRFIIGGDGPKRYLLENMINSSNLIHKVTLLGELQHNEVRKVMLMGDIYLNTSLTEAFCIANVEAASCGLHVISTDIGGVAEVLPDDMCILVRPYKKDIIKGVSDIIINIDKIRSKKEISNYDILKNTYNGDKVARKTVYEKTLSNRDISILNRFKKCFSIGNISGLFYLSLIILDYLILILLILVFKKKDIKKQKNLNYKKLKEILKNK